MADVIRKRAVGAFPNHQSTETAINELKNSGFPIENVSVLAREINSEAEIAEKASHFIPDQTVANLEKGAVRGAALGGLSGLLVGLSTFIIPGLGSFAFAGAQAAVAGGLFGAFTGGVGGTYIGAVFGDSISKDQETIYSDHLNKGDYLLMLDGTDEDLQNAESILSKQGIQDWYVYSTS
ncbi:MAG TPA: hypothetical protein V6D15_12790 [Oculatellaceae cyanobacterium]